MFPIERAVAAAVDDWRTILTREHAERERLAVKRACLIAAEGRRRDVENEIRDLNQQIFDLLADLPLDQT